MNEPTTYRQLFSDEAADPYGGEYGELTHAFRSEDDPDNAQSLFQLVSEADRSYPAAYLSVERDELGDCYYQVAFGIAKLVGKRTQWDGRAYAFIGDVVEGMITTVEWPPTAFEWSNGGEYEEVPEDAERTREWYDDAPDAKYLGPFDDDVERGHKPVRSRWCMPLPHRYVGLFLDRKVSIREGFIDLTTLMSAQGDDQRCPELMDWLLLSVTKESPDGVPRLAREPNAMPRADRGLLRHRKAVMVQQLPGLASAGPTTDRLADTMGELVQEQRLARAEAQTRATEPAALTTVAKALGTEVVKTLLALCQAESEAELPVFWRDVAAAGKRDRQTLEQSLLAQGRGLGLAEAAPVATPDLTKKVVGLQWAGLSIDDLSEGIQPFSIILPDYVGSDAGVEAQRLAETYDIMTSTETVASLKDAQTIKLSKAIIPTDYGEARAHLVALMLVWTVLLGEQHPFVLNFGKFIAAYTSREYSYQTRLRSLGTEAPPAALLLRYVQLRMITYWRRAVAGRSLPNEAPRFEEVLDKLEMQDLSWVPSIPHKYWKPLTKPVSNDLRSILSGLAFTGTPSASGTSASASSGGHTGISTLTKNTKNTEKQEPAKNPGVNSMFDPYAERIRASSIKDAMTRGGQPPTVQRNGRAIPTCISYHLKGMCWSGCARSEDHGPHTPEEDNALLNWCQAAYN